MIMCRSGNNIGITESIFGLISVVLVRLFPGDGVELGCDERLHGFRGVLDVGRRFGDAGASFLSLPRRFASSGFVVGVSRIGFFADCRRRR